MTSTVAAVATYRPAWVDADGRRVPGLDEDATTMAVAAVEPLLERADVQRVVLVTREPVLLDGDTPLVVARALGRPDLRVEERLGGAPDVLDAVLAAEPATVVVGVEPSAPAGAGAVLVAAPGGRIADGGAAERAVPVRVVHPDAQGVRSYDDPRLLRERGVVPVLEQLRAGDERPVVAVGVARRLVAHAGTDATSLEEPGGPAAVAAAFGVADEGSRIVAVEGARARAVDVDGRCPVVVEVGRVPRPARPTPTDDGVEIPISLAAYERAFDAKVGLLAGRCSCGELSFPPRYRCLSCGDEGAPSLEALPRDASVYSAITVRAPVPGMAVPYSLAIVELADVGVRALVSITDSEPGSVAIGADGRLVLRRVAERKGVPDYGYAFQPEEVAS